MTTTMIDGKEVRIDWDQFDQEAEKTANSIRASIQRTGGMPHKVMGKRTLGTRQHWTVTKVWCKRTRQKLKVQ